MSLFLMFLRSFIPLTGTKSNFQSVFITPINLVKQSLKMGGMVVQRLDGSGFEPASL